MLATGHPDARVRVWDTRTKGETLTRASLSSHKQWVAAVAWAPGSDTVVGAGAFGEEAGARGGGGRGGRKRLKSKGRATHLGQYNMRSYFMSW